MAGNVGKFTLQKVNLPKDSTRKFSKLIKDYNERNPTTSNLNKPLNKPQTVLASKHEVPGDWKLISDVNTPKSFNSYRTASGEIVHVSPAGLRYGSGSIHGDRLSHVRAHAVSDPTKARHTVFKGNDEDLFKIIDEAWANRVGAGTLQQGTKRVWNVNLNKPIGTNGEMSVRLIVEEGTERIITAYPK